MSEEIQNVDAEPSEVLPEKPRIPFKEFLESYPLNSVQDITGYFAVFGVNNQYTEKLTPELRLWCNGEECQGFRRFDGKWGMKSDIGIKEPSNDFLTYTCRDCKIKTRVFCIRSIFADDNGNGTAVKVGEFPELHIDLPSYLPTLLGDQYPYFVKGLKCEKIGCGIGAFSYYRRVIETQKGRLIEYISKVAKRLGASAAELAQLDEVIEKLDKAASEDQFSRALSNINHLIPESLRIDGHNPLSLIHKALSIGIHESNDDTCLKIAHSIRILLQDLAIRIKDTLRDDTEVKKALSDVLSFNREG
ncbi:MAG: hypothetical protein WBD27_10365 [Pyrinomonadaceae bacterium]